MLEVASELVGLYEFPQKQAVVSLRPQGGVDWELTFLASDGPDALQGVVDGEVTMGIVNPSSMLALARKGIAPFRGPLPLAALAVIPSYDQFAVAIRPELGIGSLTEVGERRYPLRVSVRGQRNHGVHWVFDHVLQAHGWTAGDLLSWGGHVSYDDGLPSRGDRVKRFAAGEIDAIVDEGVATWVPDALDAGARLLPMPESALHRLESWGYQRSVLSPQRFAGLPGEVPTVDFSGWTVYVREDAPDDLVERVCAAIAARQDRIALQDGSPLPLAEMVTGSGAAPLTVPLHEAAQRFWVARGYRPPGG
jgi:TRAP-type uncharacterized transport system substrate-binding protein